ncbi:amylo-alpha-1,6-glucosidase [Polyangium jinanense]|uniref:Amylo-alpha-1,6-glucosidase n=1 Tax=Polyangium jinanense TaxID=2829994 RepID=A0A9X3X9S2_9BACT|nr:glycogen debranching N-terminal domain-containing protein [Polyangium jinanense]MDC3959121.1 amylo-alpha-1,6-glucosidase [Polyangium jinanense]MDC3983956.1 amylo-alpha-1,6-glucosidase [Polyangium jinanense]
MNGPHDAGSARGLALPVDLDAPAPSPAPQPNKPTGIVSLDAPPSARDIRDATLLKEGDLFLLTDAEGNVPRKNREGYGLYLGDTRFLSSYELAIQGLRPTILLSSDHAHFLGAQVLTNPNLVTPEGQAVHEQTIQIRRYRLVRPTEVSESLTFQNYNRFPVTLDVELHFEADFSDMFEVRGIVKGARKGKPHAPEHMPNVLSFRYDGADGLARRTEVRFDPTPDRLASCTASYRIELRPGGSTCITIGVSVDASPMMNTNGPSAPRRALTGYKQWLAGQVGVETSNSLFNAVFAKARSDLRVLLSGDPDAPFIAAGIPWYACLFGRDTIITALLYLWISAEPARQALRLLNRHQGSRDDPARDEEPGKVMHELRRGELARLGVVPFSPYYGTVDATPLWIILLAEYYRATGDLDLVRELRPNLDAALLWMDRYGDHDGDGFLEYACRSDAGLVNQGWKDSTDAITHPDGTLAEPPIALVEVQAYAYASRRAAARIYRALGDPARATSEELRAAALRDAIDAAFWMPAENTYAIALDRDKRQVATVSSNAGHALWAGAVPHARGELMARRLMEEDLFSGWGIRTLSTRAARYNPTGYHLGTVWPHDNALIALGFKRYRQEPLALELVTALFEAAQHFPAYRMPELFCGFARSAFAVPVRYPVACSPQAWAAASWATLLASLLGLSPNAPGNELRIVRPTLPRWLHWVEVKRLSVGRGEVDLRYQRVEEHTAVDVAAMRGDVRVTFVDTWEEDGTYPPNPSNP